MTPLRALVPSRPEHRYRRREPETSVLYRVLHRNLEGFLAERRASDPDGRGLPRFIERDLRKFLRCGMLPHGFARFRCDECAAERLVAFSCKGRGFCPSCAGRRMTARAADLVDRVLPEVRHRQWVLSVPYWLRWRMAFDHDLTRAVLRVFLRAVFAFYRQRAERAGLTGARTGAVTVIQRFGGALNLNVHFHSLVPDGTWVESQDGQLTFHPMRGPSDEDLEHLADLVERRVRRLLIERGLWEDDADGGVPATTGDLPGLADIYEASVTQRAGSGARRGRRVRRVGVTMPLEPGTQLGVKARTEGGFDVHAGVTVGAKKRRRLEHLLRYFLRPPVANDALELLDCGDVLLKLRHRWSDGTTHVRLTPFELIERLVALVPRPGSNQILYHGVLAANATWRHRIVTKPRPRPSAGQSECSSARPNHTWSELMRRGLDIDSLECPRKCGGRLRFVATIEEPPVIARILRHLGLPTARVCPAPARAPPDDWQLGPLA